MNYFKDLKVWQKAVDLSVDVYGYTRFFPPEERYGLVSQINRSAVSVPSNIAEGAGRNGKQEFYNFLGIALGSTYELETQLIIAHRLTFVNEVILTKLMEEIMQIQKMIFSLQKNLKTRDY